MAMKTLIFRRPSAFVLLFIVLLLTAITAFSQKTNLIGVNLNGEVYPGNFRPSPGISFETQLGKHSGIETGIYYRTDITHGITTYSDGAGTRLYPFTIAHRYFNLPMLYKFYSRFLNFSAGPTLDLFTGWKQKKDTMPAPVTGFEVNPRLDLGFLIKAGKAILLNNRIIIEPEIRYAYLRDFGGLGVGVAVKYNAFDLH